MRISGIASGFDTDTMVKNMMAVERMKVDRFEKSKQTALWRQESYNTMNKAFANFILNTQKDMGLKKTGSTGTMTNASYKNVDYVKKATSSNEAAATVTSSSKAVNGSYKIDVEQLAQGASFSSADMRDANGQEQTFGDSLTFKMSTGMKDKDGILIEREITVEKASGSNGVTMDDIVKQINNSKVKIFEGKEVIDGKVGERILTTEELKKVTEVSLGASAFYDKSNGRLFIQSKETGKGTEISLSKIDVGSGSDGNKLIDKIRNGADGTKYDSIKGQDAKIKFNGVELNYSSNKINLNGLDIELKGITTVNNPISINVSTNTQGIMEKIEKLVNDYNDLIDLASLSVNEKAYPGYQPLTAEERKAMSESDVKLWDEKAKSGLLNRDETITRTLQAIRNDLYKTVEGLDTEFNHITKIGITTEKYSRGSAGGKLVIDTDKLKAAVEANPDAVMDLLFKEGEKRPTRPGDLTGKGKDESEGDYTIRQEKHALAVEEYETKLEEYNKLTDNGKKTTNGIFTNIYDNLITGMKAIVDKSGPGQDSDLLRGVKSNLLIDFVTKKSSISDLDKAVQDMNKQIDNLNIMLARKEDSYYAKFTAMEKAMHQMNGQSGWLAQQFG